MKFLKLWYKCNGGKEFHIEDAYKQGFHNCGDKIILSSDVKNDDNNDIIEIACYCKRFYWKPERHGPTLEWYKSDTNNKQQMRLSSYYEYDRSVGQECCWYESGQIDTIEEYRENKRISYRRYDESGNDIAPSPSSDPNSYV